MDSAQAESISALVNTLEKAIAGEEADWKTLCLTITQLVKDQMTIMQEIMAFLKENSAEAKERYRSLVIFGLPEPIASTPSERIEEDKRTITQLLDELDVEAVPTAIYRLLSNKSFDKPRPRLLKLVLSTSAQSEILCEAQRSWLDLLNFRRSLYFPFFGARMV
uniref:Uncharacterized protein n=1 Tax=Acrobeloides nanus TaxID=290746 RepID=A0A914EJT0_9BILA